MIETPMSADGYPWDERLTRQAVKGRSMGLCEWHGDHPGTDMHHRRNASQGGKWHPANIIYLCREIHQEVTVNPEWAHSVGLTLRHGEDPEQVPVQLGSFHMYLTDQLIAKAGANA